LLQADIWLSCTGGNGVLNKKRTKENITLKKRKISTFFKISLSRVVLGNGVS